MRVPLEWLNEYVDLNGTSNKEIGESFTLIGLMLDKPFDGTVFDLEHRFDRSDWLSMLGCARDLAAYLKKDLKLPETYTKRGRTPTKEQIVDIKVECPEIINRFNTRVFRNIKVKQSPNWLKNRLEEYGIPSINNVVDITNYVMVEVGQPMHAQDLSKFRKQEIVIRKAKNEEKVTSFLNDEIILYPEAFVLTQGDVATVVGGIVGGIETGVDSSTKDIILDAGNYNQGTIRKVSRKLKIQNETVQRYDKFLHPNLTQYAIERAAYLILNVVGGDYYENIDWNPKQHKTKEMLLRKCRIKQISGLDIGDKVISDILVRLGYEIRSQKEEGILLSVPYFRTDVEVEDDVVSDILRINGYPKILSSQIQAAPPKDSTPDIYKFEDELRDILVSCGGHEHITNPLVSRNESSERNEIELSNTKNSLKNALRTSLRSNLMDVAYSYMKNHLDKGVLFEIGKIYKIERAGVDKYTETRVLECFVFDKDEKPKDTHKETSSLLSTVFKSLGIENISLEKGSNSQETGIILGQKKLGILRYNGFTLYTEPLLLTERKPVRIISDIQIPNTLEISLAIPINLSVGEVIKSIKNCGEGIQKVELIEEYTGAELGESCRAALLKTYTKPNFTAASAIKLVDEAIKKINEPGLKRR